MLILAGFVGSPRVSEVFERSLANGRSIGSIRQNNYSLLNRREHVPTEARGHLGMDLIEFNSGLNTGLPPVSVL